MGRVQPLQTVWLGFLNHPTAKSGIPNRGAGEAGPPASLGAASTCRRVPVRWLFEVSEFRGYGQEWARGPLFRLTRLRTAREPRDLRLEIPIYGATEWASSAIRPAIAGVAS